MTNEETLRNLLTTPMQLAGLVEKSAIAREKLVEWCKRLPETMAELEKKQRIESAFEYARQIKRGVAIHSRFEKILETGRTSSSETFQKDECFVPQALRPAQVAAMQDLCPADLVIIDAAKRPIDQESNAFIRGELIELGFGSLVEFKKAMGWKDPDNMWEPVVAKELNDYVNLVKKYPYARASLVPATRLGILKSLDNRAFPVQPQVPKTTLLDRLREDKWHFKTTDQLAAAVKELRWIGKSYLPRSRRLVEMIGSTMIMQVQKRLQITITGSWNDETDTALKEHYGKAAEELDDVMFNKVREALRQCGHLADYRGFLPREAQIEWITEAIKTFQKIRKLPETGRLDKKTITQLNWAANWPSTQPTDGNA